MPQKKYSLILALCVFAGVALLYWPGVKGAFYYDDYLNLNGLADITNWGNFWEFVHSGGAGPLGRPLSLLTFAAQHAAWPENRADFLAVNIGIHACNAVLVFLISRQLYRLVEGLSPKENEFALIAATFWACSPILASSSLILVQRMTTLAAFFMLLTLLIYLKGFDFFEKKPIKRLIFQSLILGCGTALAAYSKENGVLLPSLTFAVELALLRKNKAAEPFRNVRLFVLGLSVVVFLIYISPLFRSWFEVSKFRGFSPWERFQGEFVIMWEYVRLAFFPRVAYFGPFQDHHVLANDVIKILVSGFAFIGLLLAAVVAHKKNPWFLFAVLWFLIGHMLESSTILLEPYFEHRNYIPLVGVGILFAYLSIALIEKYGGAVRLAVYFYIAINASILFAITSLWGNPLKAAEYWVETNPGSIRAVVHKINLNLASDQPGFVGENGEVSQAQKIGAAMQLLDQTTRWCQDCLGIYMQSMVYSCVVENGEEKRRRLVKINDLLTKRKNGINASTVESVATLVQLISVDRCTAVEYSDAEKILDGMLQQEKYPTTPRLVSKIFFQKASLAYAEGRYSETEEFISKADKNWPDAEPVTSYQIEYYVQQGMSQKAVDLIERKLKQQANKELHFPEAYVKTLENKLNEIKHGHQHSSSGQK